MEARARLDIGKLVRQRDGRADTALVGMGSYRGSVIAANSWEAPMEEMMLPPAREGSYEHVFHLAGEYDQLLVTAVLPGDSALTRPRGNRAIGVVYHPSREAGNYVPTNLPERYDAFVHLDETRPLHPPEFHADCDAVPALYPWAL